MEKAFSLTMTAANNLEIGLFRYALAPEEKFLAVNSKLYSMLGFSSRLVFSQNKFSDFFLNAKDRDVFFEILKRKGSIKFFEALFRKKNGQSLWVAVTASMVFSKDKVKCLEGIIEDISSHKNIQDKLSIEMDFLKGLLDNTPDAVYFKDINNRIMKVNKFYIKGTGLGEEEIIGKTDFDFFPYSQAYEMYKDDNFVLNTGKPIIGKVEKTLLHNGEWNQVITTKLPMRNRDGKIIGTMGITRDMTAYAHFEQERFVMLISALEVLGKALEMKDPYTFSHTRHVAFIAEAISKKMKWDDNKILGIRLAAELHDLGKITIPFDILNKPGKLTDLEYRLIKEHAAHCYNLIKDIQFPFPLAEAIYQHHERLDGSGYPRGLKGEKILPEARVLAVSDVLEAMTNHRPYRQALGIEAACEELNRGRHTRYDGNIVDTVFELVKENKGKPFWINN